MSDTSLKRQLKVLTIPVFIEMALVMMLGAVDTVMLSRYSDNSVAAVGLDNQLISLVFLVYQFFSMGAAILCAQYIGAGLRKRLVQVVGMAIVVNLILGLTVSAMLFFYTEELLQLMGLRPELMGDGLVYLRLTGALSFFQALSLTFSASLRSADKVVYPMVVTGIVNILNIITVSSLDEELINHVINEVEANISDPGYSVVQLSSAIGMTRGTLYKKLMAIVGKSPVEFIRIVRLKRAKSLLDQGRTNISEVADKVGFSPKMLAQYFREMYGDTPSEYIKQKKSRQK